MVICDPISDWWSLSISHAIQHYEKKLKWKKKQNKKNSISRLQHTESMIPLSPVLV